MSWNAAGREEMELATEGNVTRHGLGWSRSVSKRSAILIVLLMRLVFCTTVKADLVCVTSYITRDDGSGEVTIEPLDTAIDSYSIVRVLGTEETVQTEAAVWSGGPTWESGSVEYIDSRFLAGELPVNPVITIPIEGLTWETVSGTRFNTISPTNWELHISETTYLTWYDIYSNSIGRFPVYSQTGSSRYLRLSINGGTDYFLSDIVTRTMSPKIERCFDCVESEGCDRTAPVVHITRSPALLSKKSINADAVSLSGWATSTTPLGSIVLTVTSAGATVAQVPVKFTGRSPNYTWSATDLRVVEGINEIRAVATNAFGEGVDKLEVKNALRRLNPSDSPDPCRDCPPPLYKPVVNLSTGGLDYDPPDITVPGSTPLELSRQYNSDNALAGPFGRGWTHSYNMDAIPTSSSTTGTVWTVRWPTGSRLRFEEKSDGTFTGPTGWYLGASKTPEGNLILRSPNGTIHTFRGDGAIASIQAEHGRSISFGYDALGRLQSAITNSGATLSFSYNEQNKIEQITSMTGQTVSYVYNDRDLLTRVTDAGGFSTHYAYDTDDQLTTITDHEGREVLSVEYDAAGKVTKRKAFGESVSYTYDQDRKETTITDAGGVATVHRWDSNEQFVGRTDVQGGSVEVQRGAQLEVTKTVDQLGRQTSYTHSLAGNVTSVSASDGTTTLIGLSEIAGVERVTSIQLPSGSSASVSYDAATGLPTSVTDPNGSVTEVVADSSGRVTEVRSPTGRVANVTYDPDSGLPTATTVTPNDGTSTAVTRVEYDPTTRFPKTITNALGHLTQLVTDARGAVTQVTDALNGITQFEYDSAKRPVLITDALSHATRFLWDGAGRVTSVTNPADQTTTMTYTPRGDLGTVTNFRGEQSTRVYDSLRRLTAVYGPADHAQGYGYDAAGQVTGITDARGNTTSLSYTARGQLAQVVHPGADQRGVSLTYYPDGELKTVTDELDRVTTFTVDANGRTISASVAGTPATTRAYDADGRVTSVTDPLHRTTRYGYDGLGRLNALTLPDGTTYKVIRDVGGRLTEIDKTQPGEPGAPRRWLFEYDALNRLTKRTDPLGHFTRMKYDAVGNVTELDEPGTGGARLLTTISDYDSLNRPRRMVRPDETIDISYSDQLDGESLHGVTLTLTRPGRSPVTVVRRLDARERLIDERVGDTTTSYAYDANSNVTDVYIATGIAPRAHVLHYDLDARNRVTAVRDVRSNRTVALTWDAASQLTQVAYPSGITKDIAYGPRGETIDLVYKTSAGSVLRTLHFDYDDALQLKRRDETVGLSPVRSTSYEYDLRGQLTAVDYPDGTGERFTFDDHGNIVGYDKVNGSTTVSELRFHDAADQLYNVSGARQMSLTHDPRGNLTSITVNGLTTALTWDSAGRLTGITGNTTLTADYADDYRLTLFKDGDSPAVQPVWGMDNMLAEITTGGGGEQFTLHLPELDSPIERGPPNDAAQRQTLLTDHLMSAIAAYDDAGEVIPGSETEYLAYGAVKSGDASRPIGFHGARRLGSTGLYYLRHRVYSPELGRFLSRDPIGFAGGWNLYSYAAGNPVGLRDSAGLNPLAWGVGRVLLGIAWETAKVGLSAVGAYLGYQGLKRGLQGVVDAPNQPGTKADKLAHLVTAQGEILLNAGPPLVAGGVGGVSMMPFRAAQCGGTANFAALQAAVDTEIALSDVGQAPSASIQGIAALEDVNPAYNAISAALVPSEAAIYAQYQALYDAGFARARQLVARGVMRADATEVGSYIDRYARNGMRQWLAAQNLTEGPGQAIAVNRRLYDPAGGGLFRIPDVNSGAIYDGSVAEKTGALLQVQQFSSFSGKRVTIVRPTALGGSYSILK